MTAIHAANSTPTPTAAAIFAFVRVIIFNLPFTRPEVERLNRYRAAGWRRRQYCDGGQWWIGRTTKFFTSSVGRRCEHNKLCLTVLFCFAAQESGQSGSSALPRKVKNFVLHPGGSVLPRRPHLLLLKGG
jgi:hypothetical protein